ncbi:maleylpyruvate isomerase family mycothiol-dependent enzyme [Pseudonocardia saturnea]
MDATSTTDLWPAVHAERAALAADLADLSDEQWATPSLCARYSVREVLAHLTAAASLGPLRWMWSVLRSRFDFDRHNADRLAEQLGATPAETLARFRRVTESRTAPFGPKAAWLGEVVVHAEDIRRPLGIHRDHPVDVVTRVAEFYVGADFTVPSKSLTRGLRLEATDGPFAAGDGPLVRGTALALTMAMAGRDAFCDDLTGDGVAELRARARGAGGT